MNWHEHLNEIDHEYILGGPLTPAHTPSPFLSEPSPLFTANQYYTSQIASKYTSPPAAHPGGDVDWRTPTSIQQGFNLQHSTPILASNTGAVSHSPLSGYSPSLPKPSQQFANNIYADGGKPLGLGIQTPPFTGNPVRTLHQVAPGQISMADQRRMSNNGRTVMGPPETPSRITQASPQLFMNATPLFSPDLFPPHLMSGPQTAPAYPQQRLFWDSSTPHGEVYSTPQPYQDPFALPQDQLTSPFAPSSGTLPALPPSNGQQQPIVPSQGRSSTGSARPSSLDAHFPVPFTTSPRVAPSTAEDPSLFLSSPARRFGGSENNTSFSRPAPEKPAYHHQIEESKREKEFERARKAKARRSSGILVSSIEPKRSVSPANSNGRPGLRRSLTHTGAGDRRHSYHQSQVSFASTVSVHSTRSGALSRNGRSSPLKLSHDYSTYQAPSRKRTSLTFTIDEEGRAKTVVTKLPDDDLMDLDEESTESDSDSTDQPVHSFAFEEQDESPAVSRLRKEWNHSKNSSYSSRQSSHASFNSNRTNDGNAKEALRAILHDRAPTNAARRSTSLSQSQQFHSSPPVQQQGYNASPTTITDPDLSTPSTDRDSNSGTRCICNSSSPAGRMIQCESCSKWLHTHCVGINSSAIPAVYICVYCAQTPARGGRAPRPLNGSPLAHKSFQQQGQGRYR